MVCGDFNHETTDIGFLHPTRARMGTKPTSIDNIISSLPIMKYTLTPMNRSDHGMLRATIPAKVAPKKAEFENRENLMTEGKKIGDLQEFEKIGWILNHNYNRALKVGIEAQFQRAWKMEKVLKQKTDI